MSRRRIQVYDLGQVAYEPTHELQKRLVAEVTQGVRGDTLLLLEHPRTLTLGRASKAEHILLSSDELAERGYSVHEIGRGGDVTYHGPGQLVAYPIFDLNPDRRDVRRYVRCLEEVMIQVCAHYGVTARAVEGLTGTWIENRKIGAIGVRISRWVTMHGLAMNVATNLDDFNVIVPCGISDKAVTSLSSEVGHRVEVAEVMGVITQAFADVFDSETELTDGAP